MIAALMEQMLEIVGGGLGSERLGDLDRRLVAGLVTDKRGGLQASLEIAGDDEVELDIQRVKDVRELEAVTLAFFIERAFDVEKRVGAAGSSAGMAENEEIHGACFHNQSIRKISLY